MVARGAVSETKGNILHKAQAPLLLSAFISLRLLLGGEGAGVFRPGPLSYTHVLYVAMKMALRAQQKKVCVCSACMQGADHSNLHGHYGIHYHLNDAPLEASICWLTVAWDVSSLFSVYPIMLAGGLQSCWPRTCSDKQAVVAAVTVVGGNWSKR